MINNIDVPEKDRKKIVDLIKHYRDLFGLKDWEIKWTIGCKNSYTVTTGADATLHYSIQDKACTIELSPFDNDYKTNIRHEMMEILICELVDLAAKGKQKEEIINAERHRIIRRLEKIID